MTLPWGWKLLKSCTLSPNSVFTDHNENATKQCNTFVVERYWDKINLYITIEPKLIALQNRAVTWWQHAVDNTAYFFIAQT